MKKIVRMALDVQKSGVVQVISRAAPQAAAIVLSQMADRLLHARRAHGTTKSLRRVFSPAGPSASRRPGMALNSASPTDQKVAQRMGEIVTIAIVPAGMPPPQRQVPRAASAVRRYSCLPILAAPAIALSTAFLHESLDMHTQLIATC